MKGLEKRSNWKRRGLQGAGLGALAGATGGLYSGMKDEEKSVLEEVAKGTVGAGLLGAGSGVALGLYDSNSERSPDNRQPSRIISESDRLDELGS